MEKWIEARELALVVADEVPFEVPGGPGRLRAVEFDWDDPEDFREHGDEGCFTVIFMDPQDDRFWRAEGEFIQGIEGNEVPLEWCWAMEGDPTRVLVQEVKFQDVTITTKQWVEVKG